MIVLTAVKLACMEFSSFVESCEPVVFLLMRESLTIQGLMYCSSSACSRSFACVDRQKCLYLFECEHGCIIVNGSYMADG